MAYTVHRDITVTLPYLEFEQMKQELRAFHAGRAVLEFTSDMGRSLSQAVSSQPDPLMAKAQFKEALNRALNTWENRPGWLIDFSDSL